MISDDGKNLIFLFSLPRSGSTLLSLMLGTHSKVAAPPEPWFLLKLMRINDYWNASSPFDDDMATVSTRQFLDNSTFIESSRAFAITAYNQYLQRTGRTVFLDKTPRYYHILGFIDQLFPEAKKIWLKRNPMDVALSYRTTWNIGVDVLAGQNITSHTFDFSSGLFELAAYFQKQDANKYEIKYEDLVNAPRESMSGLCSFLGLSYEDNVLNYLQNSNTIAQYKASGLGDKKVFSTSSIHADSINKWRSVFSIDEIDQLTRMTGLDIYRRVGYGTVAEEIRTYTKKIVDETTATDIRVKLNSAKHDKVSELRSQLALSESDRAARLDAILELQKQRDADQLRFEELLQDKQTALENGRVLLAAAKERVAILESDKSQKEDLIAGLIQHKNYLESFDGALKVVVVKLLKKIHLYRFIQRHKRSIKKAYSNLRSMSVSASPIIKITSAEPEVLINSPLVEAFIVARPPRGNMDEHSLVDFYELGSHLHNILCIKPGDNAIQALYMLSRGGSTVTCLNWKQNPSDTQSHGFNIYYGSLAQWLIETGNTTLNGYDCILVDQPDETGDMNTLRGRVWPNTRILVSALPHDQRRTDVGGMSADRTIGAFEMYDTPPDKWLDPLPKEIISLQIDNWPLKAPNIECPAALPSGRAWPKISIVTVTYNQGSYLEETIRSVLLQGYPNLEYIVIDGGSTDNTPTILNRYRNELTYCISEKDKGQSDALNKGFRLTTGEILAWLNSDDRYMPWTLWRVAQSFDTPGIDMVAGGCALVQGDERKPFRTHHTDLPVGETVPLPLNRLLNIDGSWQKGDFFYQPEVFWSRSLWERSGAHVDEDLFYSMDYELWLRMAQSGATILHIPDTLTIFRMHENQKTSGDGRFLPELRRVAANFKNLGK